MSDRIAVMSAGEVQQIGTPEEIYRTPCQPVRRRVRRPGQPVLRHGRQRGRAGGSRSSSTASRQGLWVDSERRRRPNVAADLAVRPEALRLEAAERRRWNGATRSTRTCPSVAFLGDHYQHELEAGGCADGAEYSRASRASRGEGAHSGGRLHDRRVKARGAARSRRGGRPLQVVGAINAYAAKLAERAGFRALYLSGAGIANHSLGLPDLGVIQLGDVLTDARGSPRRPGCRCSSTSTPAGGMSHDRSRLASSSWRASQRSRSRTRRGEALRSPSGQELVEPEEMVARVRAAVAARDELLVVARTDAATVDHTIRDERAVSTRRGCGRDVRGGADVARRLCAA